MIGEKIGRTFLILVLGIPACLAIFPVIWASLSSFKETSEILARVPTFFPKHFTLENYKKVFDLLPFARFILNSVVVSSTVVVFVLFTSSLAGYIFAKFNFPFKNLLFILIISTIVIPIQVRIVPLYLLVGKLNFIDSYQGLILPFTVDAFAIFLMRQFAVNLPDEYLDAARIDGMSEFKIYLYIILPLLKPALASLAIFAFSYQWGMLMWPLIIIDSTGLKTVPLGISLLSTQRGPVYDLTLAASTLAAIPLLLVYIIFQKHFYQGVILTSGKK